MEVVNEYLIPALDRVGKGFEKRDHIPASDAPVSDSGSGGI